MVSPLSSPLVRLLRGVTLIFLVALVAEIAWFGLIAGHGSGSDIEPGDYSAVPPAIVPIPERSAFDESVERSLFSWNRRPGVAAQPVSEEDLSSKWHLTGIVNTGSATYAIFSEEAGNQRLRLEKGMYLEKWKLESILEEQVTLSEGDETQVFYLRDRTREPKVQDNRSRIPRDEDDD